MDQGGSENEILEFQKFEKIGQGFKINSLKMKSKVLYPAYSLIRCEVRGGALEK